VARLGGGVLLVGEGDKTFCGTNMDTPAPPHVGTLITQQIKVLSMPTLFLIRTRASGPPRPHSIRLAGPGCRVARTQESDRPPRQCQWQVLRRMMSQG